MKMDRLQKALDIVKHSNYEKDKDLSMVGDLINVPYIDALNCLFGSFGEIIQLNKPEQQLTFSKLFLSVIGSNRSQGTNVDRGDLTVNTERWLLGNNSVFIKNRNNEIGVLEDIIMGVMIYLLGGFTFPDDELRAGPLKHMQVDTSEILAEPRKSFLLLNINPRHTLLYLIWKIDCLVRALSREYLTIYDKNHVRKSLKKLRDVK